MGVKISYLKKPAAALALGVGPRGVTTVCVRNLVHYRMIVISYKTRIYSFSNGLFVGSFRGLSGWPSNAVGKFFIPRFFGDSSSSFVIILLSLLSAFLLGEFGNVLLGDSLFFSLRNNEELSIPLCLFLVFRAYLRVSFLRDVLG